MTMAEIKATSRQALHEFMARPVSFYETEATPSPTTITGRAHAAPKVVGDLAGTNLSYAEVHERPTTVVLLRSELTALTLTRGSLIIFEATEGWFVETVKPPDGLTVTVEVSPLSSTSLDGKELPDGSIIGA